MICLCSLGVILYLLLLWEIVSIHFMRSQGSKRKEKVFFAGVEDRDKESWYSRVPRRQPTLLWFRFRSVRAKRASDQNQAVCFCQPLIEKITLRIQSWKGRFLSYAGRLKLVKSVLNSLHVFWSNIFILPKKGHYSFGRHMQLIPLGWSWPSQEPSSYQMDEILFP